VLEAAAVGVPDKRLGELPVAIVTLKKGHEGTVQEQELLKAAEARCASPTMGREETLNLHRLPKFAVPVMVIIQKELLGESNISLPQNITF
jgi:acyl-CoA synthetase (AMP-forming)/AMP-acid ligase II